MYQISESTIDNS